MGDTKSFIAYQFSFVLIFVLNNEHNNILPQPKQESLCVNYLYYAIVLTVFLTTVIYYVSLLFSSAKNKNK